MSPEPSEHGVPATPAGEGATGTTDIDPFATDSTAAEGDSAASSPRLWARVHWSRVGIGVVILVAAIALAYLRSGNGDIVRQAVLTGILIGGVYGLVAMGLTLIFGVLDIVNFAHGAFLAVALYITVTMVSQFGVNPLVALFVVLGLPVLAALILEQQLATESDRYKARLFGELPVVAEQLGMLLGAGYSLGAALGRLADRGNGLVATDLRRVLNRVHQGLSIDAALGEWADLADVDELARLVQVLGLHRAAADLGHLIAEEARSIRREAHRNLVARMEQRAQLVWIPVTVAALLPGALFLAIPFADALRLVTS